MAPEQELNQDQSQSHQSVDDIIDLLAGDPVKDDEKQEEEVKDDKKSLKTKVDEQINEEVDENDGEEEEEELKLNEEEPEEEDLKLSTPPQLKDIKAKYPNVFKDFPGLKIAYFREKAYTELIPTIEDAKHLVERNQEFEQVEQSIFKGSLDTVLKSVKDSDPDSFGKIVDNLLPDLFKADQAAYYHVIQNINRHTIALISQKARDENSDELKAVAYVLNQFLFGNGKPTLPERFFKGKTEEETTQNTEITQMRQQRLNDVSSDLNTKTRNALTSTISLNIDPKESMTDYVKSRAIKDCLEEVETSLTNDSRFRIILNKAWEEAFKTNLSRESVNKIQSIYLAQAKAVLPRVILKHRNEALKGLGRGKTEKKEIYRGSAPSKPSGNKTDSGSKKMDDKPLKSVQNIADFLGE
jgi:ribosomal protein L22